MENVNLTSEELDEELKNSPVYNLTKSQQLFLAALKSTLFDISAAAKKCGLHRRNHHYYIESNPDYKAAVENSFEEQKDAWESESEFAIYGQYTINKDNDGNPNEFDQNGRPIRHYINPPDRAMLKFKMLTKAKDRGYVYRQEITGADANPLFGGFEVNVGKKANIG